MKPLQRYVPIFRWLPSYGRRDLRGDVVAGLTVGVMLIPQGMAYAILAGIPPIYGLYAALVPLLVYPVLGTSRHLALGIVAIDMLIMAAGLSDVAAPGTARYVELAVVLALMVGGLQLGMGLARLGFLVNLLSRPVIVGFTAAAALTIGLSQLKNLLGLPLPPTSHAYTLLWEAGRHLTEVHPLSVVLGLGSIGLLLALRRWWPRVPAPLVAVVLSTLAVWWFRWDAAGVQIVGDIPKGLPRPQVPALDVATLRALFPTALTLALVQFMGVISLGKVFAARHRYSVAPNLELIALGTANIAGSFFRSVPVSGSFGRTAVNEQAGARSALSNVVAAALVALTLLFFTALVFYLPIPTLAAIIMVAVFGLINLKELRFLLYSKRVDGYLAIVTFLATLLIGIQEGVLLGIAASVVAIFYRISRPNVAVLGHLPGTRSFRDLRRHPEAQEIDGILMLRIDASFSFANADLLKDLILERSSPEDHLIRAVVVDASSVNDLDLTAALVLKEVYETLQARGIAFYFGGAKYPVLEVLKRTGLYEQMGADHFCLSPHRAVRQILTRWGVSRAYLETVPGASGQDDA